MKYLLKLYCVFLCFAILFSGCSVDKSEKEQIFTEKPTQTVLPEPTERPTDRAAEPPETLPPATEPDLSLHVDAGDYLLRFTDENSKEYLDYYLFIPKNAEINMPLIIFLHGISEVGKPEVLENYGLSAAVKEFYGDEFPFLLVSPSTHIRSWTDKAVSDTLKALIDELVQTYRVDPNRIVITGHSLGAIGVWNMISTYGDFFAGAVPVSCGIDLPMDYERCAQVPVYGFVGTLGDYENRYRRAMIKLVDQINQAGGNAFLTVLEGATHSDTTTAGFTEETFNWILERKRGD